ncbi:TIGR01459 family HAD-type hydrolase [Methylobacterium sp. J-088]|uniref:TIGR01459 family HAD-type hydrolase n=1 Tax=Methylobacterium sp. J-088 TaxID=2836664 RepID=UPI001FB8EC52|nr:TIGR01459 family HAD-type hydrolase [Methylobacterium sp. J-088]MCJ2063726.1 TIGR01459 family HAD-type hydrolase [Methylobacterium sp. J-088]
MADAPAALAGLSRLAEAYAVILCDVFGVLHDATRVFPAAAAALAAFRAGGGTVVLISNAAEPGARLSESLRARGIRDTYDDLVTAADVARSLLVGASFRRVHHIGAARDRVLFADLPVTPVPVDTAEQIVCTGYPDCDDDLDATLAAAAQRGLHLLCTNPDTCLTVGATHLRFAGLVAARYRAFGGHVVETGKPGALIYRRALDKAERSRGQPVDPTRILGIGDTVALDVVGALGNGFGALHIGTAQPPPADASTRLYRMPALVW